MWPKARAALPLWLRLALLAALVTYAVSASAAGHRHRGPRALWGGDDDEDEDPSHAVGDEDEDYPEDDAGGGGGGDDDEVEDAQVNVQLTQFDYSDACANLADARWLWLLAGEPGSGPEEALLWEREAGMAAMARRNLAFMQGYSDLRERVPKAPAPVLDEIDYSLHAGDLLLSQTAFMQKLNYSRAAQKALSDLRVPCEGDTDSECVMTLPVVRRVLARSGDAAQQLRALDHALQQKGLKGRVLYEAAYETLNTSLGIEGLPIDSLLRQVRYDGECPAHFVHNCSSGAGRALACSTAGWQEYAEAHEVLTRLAHEHLGAEEDKKNLIRVVTRYSATHDMLASVIRLLSLHPDRLEELGVLPDEEDYEELAEAESGAGSEDDEVHRGEATLRLLTALRTLPRLAYLAAGDAFRLRLLAAVADNAHANANGSSSTNASAPVDPVALWAQVRREYMLVAAAPGEEGDAAWLADAALAGNEPLLGRFLAELLAFQSLEYLASYDPAHPLPATLSDARVP